LAVVLLSIVEDKVLVVNCLPVGFLNLWCHIEVVVIGGFHRLVGGIGDGGAGFAFVAEVVVVVGGDWVNGMIAWMEALASVRVGEVSWQCTGAP
jgi:hypothetical protein